MSATQVDRAVAARLDARFQERREQVPVLRQRAEVEGITAIRSREEMVPLLFPHTTYKSYPEALVARGQWRQMNRWLDSLSTSRVDIDVDGVTDVDGWIDRLHTAGHLVTSSSGTSGKSSFLNKTARDEQTSLDDLIDCFAGIGLPPRREWHVIPAGPETGVSHHNAVRKLIVDTFGRPDAIPLPAPKEAGGHHSYMSRLTAMRRAVADGSARPDQIAAFEREAKQRQEDTDERLRYLADRVIEHRDEKLLFIAMFPLLFTLCELLEGRGLRPGDFTGANAMTSGGGLKGATLPPDYQERIFRLLNIAPSRLVHYYSMQELNVRMPKCVEGRFHVPAHLELFVLTKDGERLADASDGQVEGRAAFFDTTVDGRWGGTISGDKVVADHATCPCGRSGPTVLAEIVRYSDLADDDKITCAGTMDAYVRGFVEG